MTMPYSILLLFTAAFSLSGELMHYRTMQEANGHFRKGDYFRAEQRYRNAIVSASKDGERVTARFNLAVSLAMQRKYREAIGLYRTVAMKPGEKKMRNLCRYNEATCLARLAMAETGTDPKRELLEQALEGYAAVLFEEPDETDARINYEIVYRMLQKLKTPPSRHPEDGSEKSGNGTASNAGMKTAERILENAQLQENSLLRRLPRASGEERASSKNRKDW
ncbi:MAG: tetratricopeptide repeat protein [Chlorobi bacterium]|nr:tetratricopeptide repeat protein [Chlorobiota bacterium]